METTINSEMSVPNKRLDADLKGRQIAMFSTKSLAKFCRLI